MIDDIDHTGSFPNKCACIFDRKYHLTLYLLMNAGKLGYLFPKMVDGKGWVIFDRKDYLVDTTKNLIA